MRLEYPAFGKIIVDGATYEHDIVLYPSGKVERRKKKISKQKHGTSHKLDPEELKEYLTEDFDVLVVGTGMYGKLSLLPESRELIKGKKSLNSQPKRPSKSSTNSMERKKCWEYSTSPVKAPEKEGIYCSRQEKGDWIREVPRTGYDADYHRV